jgi:L-ribulose-5-phosphate 3-epimerase
MWPASNDLTDKIGFMQGRLSPLIDGKIQAFPWQYWRDEFELGARNGFHLMEWTLDQERLYENPLMYANGRGEIRQLMEEYGISIPSLTGDCFMQAPFYKTSRQGRQQLLADFANIIESSAELGISTILMPLLDHGRIENKQQQSNLLRGLSSVTPLLEKTNIILSFESDLPPESLSRFINNLDPRYFGITYDIGNSASLGYKPEEEINLYGHRIVNVHVKDRMFGGSTVPLGAGNADIPGALRALRKTGYNGNYILQAARAADEDHVGALRKYRDMVENWLYEEDE